MHDLFTQPFTGRPFHRFPILALLLSFGLLVSGCASTTVSAEASGVSASASLPTAGDTGGIPSAPDRTADYYGIVRKIIGNEVTLSLVTQTDAQEEERTEEEKAARKAERQAMSVEERQALKNAQITTTGEEARIVIPVGSPITSGGNGTGTEAAASVLTERSLEDIKEGMFVKFWTSEGGSGADPVAAYTRVLQAPQ